MEAAFLAVEYKENDGSAFSEHTKEVGTVDPWITNNNTVGCPNDNIDELYRIKQTHKKETEKNH